MGQCDVKFVFERDIQSFSNRWGWEQRWSHFIKESRVGNCSSKVHTAEVEMFRHHWGKRKKKPSADLDGVTVRQDVGCSAP